MIQYTPAGHERKLVTSKAQCLSLLEIPVVLFRAFFTTTIGFPYFQ